MSILSRFLKKNVGVPEVDISKYPIGTQLIIELTKNGVKEVFSYLSDEDMKLIDKAVQVELYHRKVKYEVANKAGIGVAYDTKSD